MKQWYTTNHAQHINVALLICFLLTVERLNGVTSFHITPSLVRSESSTQLWGRSNSRNASRSPSKVKSKAKGGSKSSKRSKGGRSSMQLEAPVGRHRDAEKKKKSTGRPPWQVLSSKEAKRNIESEKKRRSRERARQSGTISPQVEVAAPVEEENAARLLSKSLLSEVDRRFLKWKRFNPAIAPHRLRFLASYHHGDTISGGDKDHESVLGVPQVVFLGRSNVGKSSLLNRLVASSSSGIKSGDQARVGKTPGATASVNLYGLEAKPSGSSKGGGTAAAGKTLLGMVDFPGYGYAKLSKETQAAIQATAERYLARHRRHADVALGILLVDIRRNAPTAEDKAVLAALYDKGLPLIVVATKLDKLKSATVVDKHLADIRDALGLPDGQPLAVSSVTGEGIPLLWNILLEACEGTVREFKRTYEEVDQDDDEEYYENYEVSEQGFYDDDEIAYSQGYDWIHDDGTYYEHEGLEARYVDHGNEDDDRYEFLDDEDAYYDTDDLSPKKESFRSLQQRALDLERRGKV